MHCVSNICVIVVFVLLMDEVRGDLSQTAST